MSPGNRLPRSSSDGATPADPTPFAQAAGSLAVPEAAPPTRFHSILFPPKGEGFQEGTRAAPDALHDLNLDRVFDSITAGREEYDLGPLFRSHLTDLDAVRYRQEVMRDMEGRVLAQAVGSFAERMRTMRRCFTLATKSSYELERQRWFLSAAEAYGDAVEGLTHAMGDLGLVSHGLRAFRDFLGDHTRSQSFRTLVSETRALAAALAAIRYCVLIHDGGVTVSAFDGQIDYSMEVEATFRKFQQGTAKDYAFEWSGTAGMNHVEAQILERVVLLNPGPFSALAQHCARYADFPDPTIVRFDREIQFYVAYLEYVGRFRDTGLSFCYPRMSNRRGTVVSRDGFDLALADKLLQEGRSVVCNDFRLQGAERMLVVTGPNQGGKTTFARMFGQLHYLAGLGCPVPGHEATLFLFDRLFTHFEREEDIASLRGKLEDDLVRIRHILDEATPNSIVILNEIFSSATLDDALFLGREVLDRISRLDLLGVCVTFLDELSRLSEKTVSMVSMVDPSDPAVRTYRIERLRADGLAHALAIAEKHRVTYRYLKERIPR